MIAPLLLLAYPLSYGPAVKLYYSKFFPFAARTIIEAAYYPLIFLMGKSEPFEQVMDWYIRLWFGK